MNYRRCNKDYVKLTWGMAVMLTPEQWLQLVRKHGSERATQLVRKTAAELVVENDGKPFTAKGEYGRLSAEVRRRLQVT